MTAVEIEVAFNLDAFGQAFEVVGLVATPRPVATAAYGVNGVAAGLDIDMHQRIVVADAAHGHIAVGFNATTAETGAAGVEAATVDVDIAVGAHAGTGITVYGLPAGTAHGKAVAVGGERGSAAVDNDVIVA